MGLQCCNIMHTVKTIREGTKRCMPLKHTYAGFKHSQPHWDQKAFLECKMHHKPIILLLVATQQNIRSSLPYNPGSSRYSLHATATHHTNGRSSTPINAKRPRITPVGMATTCIHEAAAVLQCWCLRVFSCKCEPIRMYHVSTVRRRQTPGPDPGYSYLFVISGGRSSSSRAH